MRHDAVPFEAVLIAARVWAADLVDRPGEVVRIGYFGSYGRSNYVPGSQVGRALPNAASSTPAQSGRARPTPLARGFVFVDTVDGDREPSFSFRFVGENGSVDAAASALGAGLSTVYKNHRVLPLPVASGWRRK